MSNLRLKDVIGDYVESCKTIARLQITISELRSQINILQQEVFQLRRDVSYLKSRDASGGVYRSYGDDAFFIAR